MKQLPILVLLLVFTPNVFAQNITKWERYQLSFESALPLEINESAHENDFDSDNENMAVSIEAVDIEEESYEFLADMKYACREICEDMDLKFIKNGDEFMSGHKNFYIVCEDTDYDESPYPVIVAVIIKEDIKKVFEITVDCYDKNLSKGLQTIKTFKYY